MKTIAVLLLTLLFTTPFVDEVENQKTKGTDIKIAENLIEAIKDIDIVSMNVHLSEGADVDTVDQAGNTPLMLASKIGNPRMVRILLAHYPELNKQNNQGYTALMIASENGQRIIAEQLIEKGADIHATNNNGLNALELATRNGHPSVIELFKEKTEIPMSR